MLNSLISRAEERLERVPTSPRPGPEAAWANTNTILLFVCRAVCDGTLVYGCPPQWILLDWRAVAWAVFL